MIKKRASPRTDGTDAKPPQKAEPQSNFTSAGEARKCTFKDSLKERFSRVWAGDKGETYEIKFNYHNNWRCTREDSFGVKKFTLIYDDKTGYLWWGFNNSYFCDTGDLAHEPNRLSWYVGNDERKLQKPRFVWLAEDGERDPLADEQLASEPTADEPPATVPAAIGAPTTAPPTSPPPAMANRKLLGPAPLGPPPAAPTTAPSLPAPNAAPRLPAPSLPPPSGPPPTLPNAAGPGSSTHSAEQKPASAAPTSPPPQLPPGGNVIARNDAADTGTSGAEGDRRPSKSSAEPPKEDPAATSAELFCTSQVPSKDEQQQEEQPSLEGSPSDSPVNGPTPTPGPPPGLELPPGLRTNGVTRKRQRRRRERELPDNGTGGGAPGRGEPGSAARAAASRAPAEPMLSEKEAPNPQAKSPKPKQINWWEKPSYAEILLQAPETPEAIGEIPSGYPTAHLRKSHSLSSYRDLHRHVRGDSDEAIDAGALLPADTAVVDVATADSSKLTTASKPYVPGTQPVGAAPRYPPLVEGSAAIGSGFQLLSKTAGHLLDMAAASASMQSPHTEFRRSRRSASARPIRGSPMWHQQPCAQRTPLNPTAESFVPRHMQQPAIIPMVPPLKPPARDTANAVAQARRALEERLHFEVREMHGVFDRHLELLKEADKQKNRNAVPALGHLANNEPSTQQAYT